MKGEDWLGKVFRKAFQPNEAIFDEDFTLVGEKVDHYRLLQFRIKTDEMLDFIYLLVFSFAMPYLFIDQPVLIIFSIPTKLRDKRDNFFRCKESKLFKFSPISQLLEELLLLFTLNMYCCIVLSWLRTFTNKNVFYYTILN